MDQTQEALKALLSAIEVGPRYFKAYQQLGGFYYDRGDYERAVEYLKKVVELIPGNPEGHVILAAPYAKLGRFAEAERELRAALDLRETLDAHVNLGAVLAYQCRYLEAIAHEQRAVALAPNDYMTWVNLGDNYRRTYQPAQTRQAYQRGLDLTQREVSRNPQDVGSRAFLAYLLARLGKRGQAEFEISQSLQMPPPDAQVLRMAALTYEALGQRENTLSVLKSAPSSLIADLSRQPDMTGLITDSRFIALLPKH
jgi:serine/threonine-protein kinase